MQFTQLTAVPKAWGDQLARQLAGLSYVQSGLAVTAHGPGSRQVDIAAGTGWVNGVFVNYAGGNLTPAAPVAAARIDVIRIAAGAVVPSVLVGAESATPVEPALGAGDLFLGTVFTPLGALDYTTGGYVNDYTMAQTFGPGQAANPTMTFSGDLTTGFFRAGPGIIGASIVGLEQARLDANRLLLQGRLDMAAAASRIVPGVTSFAIRDNANANDNLLVSNAGAGTFRAGVTATGVTIVSSSGTALSSTTAGGAPGALFTDNSNMAFSLNTTQTGLGLTGAYFNLQRAGATKFSVGLGPVSGNNVLEIATGASLWLSVDGTGATKFPAVGTTASAANAFLDNAASNNLLRSTSSLRYKNRGTTLELDEARSLVIRWPQPFWYTSRSQADHPFRQFLGFAAEEVAAIDERFVTHDEFGRPDWVQYERIVAPLLVVVQDQQRRIALLEGRVAALAPNS